MNNKSTNYGIGSWWLSLILKKSTLYDKIHPFKKAFMFLNNASPVWFYTIKYKIYTSTIDCKFQIDVR